MLKSKKNTHRKTARRNAANPSYSIMTFGSLGYSSVTNQMVFDGVSGYNFDVAAYMEADTNYNVFVKGQYSYFRIKSVKVQYIPRDPNATSSSNPPAMFVAGLTFGRDSGSWTVTSIDQIPGAKTTSLSRGFTHIFRCPDKTWFTTVTSDEPLPKIRFVTLPVINGLTVDVAGVIYLTFNVECKGRLV